MKGIVRLRRRRAPAIQLELASAFHVSRASPLRAVTSIRNSDQEPISTADKSNKGKHQKKIELQH
jgi:plastocyanin domain-containing protein